MVPKYELAISLRTIKNGPVIRNRLRLPHAVNTSQRVAIICAPGSPAAALAIKAGASLVGEDVIFDAVKAGRIEFERCLCHVDSQAKLAQSGLARILGPRQLMPNAKNGTIVKDITTAMRNMIGATEYREKLGVVRLPIGQLKYTPEELQANIKTFMEKLKADVADISEKISKEIHEVVCAPGISFRIRTPTNELRRY